MSKHEVEIPKLYHKIISSPLNNEAGSTAAALIVKPPITPSEVFNNAILGREGYGVNLSHVVTNSEKTVFLARSSLETKEQRGTSIYAIAGRVKRLADSPEKVVEFLDDNPFPSPQKK